MDILKKAAIEFDILDNMRKKYQPITVKFREEILSILQKFKELNLDEAEANNVASEIRTTLLDLYFKMPLSPLILIDEEWDHISDSFYQNKRCAGVFKDGDNLPYYLHAIIFRDGDKLFYGTVDGISSEQIIKAPFMPKSFYVDVVKEYSPESKTGYVYHIKDLDQLKNVFIYYPYGSKK